MTPAAIHLALASWSRFEVHGPLAKLSNGLPRRSITSQVQVRGVQVGLQRGVSRCQRAGQAREGREAVDEELKDKDMAKEEGDDDNKD